MTEVLFKKRGPLPGSFREEPIFRDKVLEIIRLREMEDMTYSEIADRVGGTRMGMCSSYHRWKAWGREQLARSADRRTA